MPRTKSEWKQKLEALKKDLPGKFDARKFKGCRVDGNLDASLVKKVCEELKYTGKEEAIIAFLKHYADKKPAVGKKKAAKKKESVVVEGKTLLSKKTYRALSAKQIGKLIELLTDIQKTQKEKDIADLKAKKHDIEKELKELQAN